MRQHFPTKTPLYAIRTSIILFLLRLCTVEIGIELLYLGWLWHIDKVGYRSDILSDLYAASAYLFIGITVLQALLFLVLTLRWYFEYYVITANEILHRRGLLVRDEQLYPYRNIQTVTVHQSLIGRVLNYGTVKVYIPTLGKELRFDKIPSPEQFVEVVENAMPKDEEAKFIIRQ